jgi:pyruvate/2-oxoglutarate dehydrogenase complex dihydrolipoamide dehydrogenase (E3) component
MIVHAAIIGSGQAGPALATALAADGETVALFEGAQLGGTCVNSGCTPTKTLRKSARVAHLARRASEFGVETGPVTVNFHAAMERMASIVSASREGLGRWVGGTTGVTLVYERATLQGREDGKFVIRAGDTTYHADRVYLNVGTHASLPPVPGLAATTPLLNDTLLELRERPAHLLILGGSYIGLELGQIFRRLGSKVTIVEGAPTIVAREDADVSARLVALLTSEGVTIVSGASVSEASGTSGQQVSLTGTRRVTDASGNDAGSEDFRVSGSHLLVATGRRPNSAELGLDTVGVHADAQGYVTVNGALETNVPGIFALGDVNRRGAFTHTSYQDHEIVIANRRGGNRTADGRVSTYALFTDPPLGRVGLSETEARALMTNGRRFLMATHEMKFVSRAKEESETVGVIKVLVEADTHRFVGATIFGIGGDEIVQIIGVLMEADAPFEALRDFLPVHPTVTEFFPTILKKLKPLA